MVKTLDDQQSSMLEQQAHIDDLTAAVRDISTLLSEAEVHLFACLSLLFISTHVEILSSADLLIHCKLLLLHPAPARPHHNLLRITMHVLTGISE